MSRAHTQLADNKCILAGSLGSSLRLGSCQRFCWDQLGRVVLLRAGGLGFGGGKKKGKNAPVSHFRFRLLSQRGMCSPTRAHISSGRTGNCEGLTDGARGRGGGGGGVGGACGQLRP